MIYAHPKSSIAIGARRADATIRRALNTAFLFPVPVDLKLALFRPKTLPKDAAAWTVWRHGRVPRIVIYLPCLYADGVLLRAACRRATYGTSARHADDSGALTLPTVVPSVSDVPFRQWKLFRCLVHEAVHVLAGPDRDVALDGHGPRFCVMADAVAAVLNIAPPTWRNVRSWPIDEHVSDVEGGIRRAWSQAAVTNNAARADVPPVSSTGPQAGEPSACPL
jgi:hypothetical protein